MSGWFAQTLLLSDVPSLIWMYYSTYLLTPWCRVLPEQLVKKFPAIHGTRRFITALTGVRHLSLSWACPIQSTWPHHTSWRSILILSTHLGLGLPSGLFPSGFPTKTLYTPLSSPNRKEGCDCLKTGISFLYGSFRVNTVSIVGRVVQSV